MNIETDYSLELFYDFNGFQLLFSALFRLFGLGLGCCSRDFCGFSSFWGGFGVLFWEFLRFQLLFSDLFRIFGRVWGAVLQISAVSATFFLIFFGFLAGFGGAVLGISAVSAPQDPLAMLSTYGYCTL